LCRPHKLAWDKLTAHFFFHRSSLLCGLNTPDQTVRDKNQRILCHTILKFTSKQGRGSGVCTHLTDNENTGGITARCFEGS
jgi:hypothetical protein